MSELGREGARAGTRGPRVVAALAVVGIAAAVGLELWRFGRELRRAAASGLATMAGQRAAEVERWRGERLSDGRVIAAYGFLGRDATLAARGSSAARARLGAWCVATIEHHDEYDAAVVFGPDGEKLAGRGPGAEAAPAREHLARAREGGVFLSELHPDGAGMVHADLVAPLRPAGPGAEVGGYALLRIDSDVHLLPTLLALGARRDWVEVVLVQRRPAGEGATLAVGREARGEPPPGWATSPAPAASASVGGAVEWREGGRSFLVAVAPIEGSSLSVAVKADLAAVYAPLRERATAELALGAALAVAIGGAAHLWWRAQREAFRRAEREEELRRLALERHFSYLTRFANDALLLADGRLRIVEANDRAEQLYGRPRDELLGLHVGELLAPRSRRGLEARLREIDAGQGGIFEALHRRRDGGAFPVEVSARLIDVDGERFLQSIVRDITERKGAERALRASAERLRLALEASAVGVWDWSAWTGELWASETFERLLGYGPAELAALAEGGVEGAAERLVHPEDHVDLAPRLAALTRGDTAELGARVRVRTRAGAWIRVVARARVLERDGAGVPLRVAGTVAEAPAPESPDPAA